MNNINNTTEATNTNNMTEKETATMKNNNTHNTKPKAIICNETNEFFFSVCSAAKAVKLDPMTIRHILEGKTKNPRGGLTFRYATAEEIASVEKEIVVQQKSVVKGKGKRMNGNTKAVFNFSKGEFYTSANDAAERLNASVGHISFACRNKGRTVKGNKICYIRDINEHLDEISESIHKANMYDDMMTKEEKRKELFAEVQKWESEINNIEDEIGKLYNALTNAERELEKAKHNLMYFGF